MKKIIKNNCVFKAIDRYLRKRYTGFPDGERYQRGHFYSPLPDLSELSSDDELPNELIEDSCQAINLQEESQRSLLEKFLSFYKDFNYTDRPHPKRRFYLGQEWFCHGDALILYSMIRHLQPQRIIEVGSGFSSALILDTVQEFREKQTELTFIEPYPDRLNHLISREDHVKCSIIQQKIQDVHLDLFREMQSNDILFIDSSHVSKYESDVNFIFFKILPLLQPGVVIHFHDVMWPFEYPKKWVKMGRAWNEAYLLRAFLQYNQNFRILLFNSYAGYQFKSFFEDKMPLFLRNTGGSIWLQKVSN